MAAVASQPSSPTARTQPSSPTWPAASPPHLALVRGDAFRYLRTAPPFDLIFADPPYALPRLPELPEAILGRDLLRPGGFFILEHPGSYDFSTHPLFTEMRTYGAVHFSLFHAPKE